MKSFGLLRTNVGLTTNIKIIVDSNYKLYLDSIESHPDLARDKFKKVQFIKSNYWDELIPFFYKDLPSEIAFTIKDESDSKSMSNNFANQYDELYNYGARNIINNKSYSEEFEYFAPLYVSGTSLPKKFIIFRVDGTGFESGLELNRLNFRTEIIEKLKTVKVFDLAGNSPIGEWMALNFRDNKFLPQSPLDIDFRPLEFCRWNGIDYTSGGWVSKSLFLDDFFDEEKEIHGLEKFIFSKWAEQAVVFGNILNFSFLFDDTPSTPDIERKWSLNRYFGFYIDDLVQTRTISPYITPLLKPDAEILEGNIIYSPTGGEDGFPFLDSSNKEKAFWVEWRGNYYQVESFDEELAPRMVKKTVGPITTEVLSTVTQTRWRIISDTPLTGLQQELNTNFGRIDESGYLINYENEPLIIDEFSQADVWLIEIEGNYYNIIKEVDANVVRFRVNSDLSFYWSINEWGWRVAGENTSVSNIVDRANPPKFWRVFKCKFSDIKDFDTRIVDTEYSKYEYEKEFELTETDETKMWVQNLSANSFPKPIDDFILNDRVVNIPVSSEYTANCELFKVEDQEISSIWKKNPITCRWVFQNSISANDYPYLLNNSQIFEDWNRTANIENPEPKRIERNLDYFLTINSSTSSYTHHSLHVERLSDMGDIDSNFRFELDKYLNLATYSVDGGSATYSFDYFSAFFGEKSKFSRGNIIQNRQKYSLFNPGDIYTPNSTLFRGIKFWAWNVDSILQKSNGDVESFNLSSSDSFRDWKFSILMSDNDFAVNNAGQLVNSNNDMEWQIISDWQMDKEYRLGQIVSDNDILYISNTASTITQQPTTLNTNTGRVVKSAPHNQLGWSFYQTANTILWSPNKTYTWPSTNVYDWLVYNNGNWWLFNQSGIVDFWNPIVANTTGYSQNAVVLWDGEFWRSATSSNSFSPDNETNFSFTAGSTNWINYWEKTTSTQSRWTEVELWNPSGVYNSLSVVVHNGIVWQTNTPTLSGEEPNISNKWIRKYNIEPDTDYIYSPTDNPIIRMNNRWYLNLSNTGGSTLDNGITVYINKKWRNILININIADGTIPNISESDRDILYTDLNSKLTAYNFSTSINDLTKKYGFTDWLSYVVIEENGSISKYNMVNNLAKLPFLLQSEGPETLNVKVESLVKKPILKANELKVFRSLNNGRIDSREELNWWNSGAIAYEIEENKFPPKVFENYHGNKNFTSDVIYRFSGPYMPLFYEIQLFNKGDQFAESGNFIFDTSLTEFGIIKERVVSKVNRSGSVLKLRDAGNLNSIFPQLDEFGYSVADFFIFSSTWQFGYHFETYQNPRLDVSNLTIETVATEILTTPGISPISQPDILDTLPEIGLKASLIKNRNRI